MFFRRCKVRKLQSTLLRMMDDDGRLMEDMGEIRDHIVSFYTSLLGTEVEVVEHPISTSPGVGEDSLKGLVALPSFDEIRKAVFSIGINKSPGLDGFGSLFF